MFGEVVHDLPEPSALRTNGFPNLVLPLQDQTRQHDSFVDS